MLLKSLRLALAAATLVAGAACNSTSEPRKAFNLCVHAQGAPFLPGSTGDACAVPQLVRAGQTRTVELEADIYSGDDRTAIIAIEFAPNGWTLDLGGPSIPVPGQQTLTFTVPVTTTPGDYQIAVIADSLGEQVILVFTVAVSAPV